MKWRYSETHRVDNVEAAIVLAERFKNENKFNWFRGQTQPWAPHSSLFRRQKNDPSWEETVLIQMGRYHEFVSSHVELKKLVDDTNAFFAVAQHYGLPTSYIDFSTEPAVAGFFACDGSDPAYQGESCIYCLNTDDLESAWETLQGVRPDEGVEYELVHLQVSNLWRLESQHGVFLYVQPANWEDWYEMDRIVFPCSGPPAYPSRDVVYPDHKSALEILLDQFLMAEKMRRGNEELRKMLAAVNVPINVLETPPDYFHPECFVDGKLDVVQSWSPERLSDWVDDDHEPFHDLADRRLRLELNPQWSNEEIPQRLSVAIEGAFRIHKDLRRQRVSWDLGKRSLSAGGDTNEALERALRWAWDGMRRLPYTDAQIARALATCVQLFALGLSAAKSHAERKIIAEKAFGPSLAVQFGAPDGSYANAFVGRSLLRDAWRDDLDQRIAEDMKERLGREETMLQAVYNPRRLFEFERLASLFAAQLIPWQVLVQRDWVAFFGPSRLATFGLP